MGDHNKRKDGMNEVAPRPRFARALRSFGGPENRNTSEFLGILANPSESSRIAANPNESSRIRANPCEYQRILADPCQLEPVDDDDA